MTAELRRKWALDGPKSQGKTNYLKHLDGQRLTRQEAILAKCFECSGYYVDGRVDCLMADCPLYPFAPYQSRANKHIT